MTEKSDIADMVKKYSEKWGVPEDEAEKNIKKFIESKPVSRKMTMPTAENLFPDPIGALSEKVMGINQAVLSTAYTKKSMREMNQQPEEIQNLSKRVDDTMETVNKMLELMNTTMKDMQKTLEDKQEEEKRKALVDEIETRVIKPLKDDLEKLKEELEEKPPDTKDSLRTMRERIKGFEEDARGALEELGIEVPERRVVVEAPSVPMKDEELVADLKRRGYRVEFDMISREEAEKMAEKAREGVEADQLEDRRILAVENIVRDAMNNIFEMFKEPLQRWMESSMTAPAEREPAERDTERPESAEPSKQQES